MVPSRPLSAGSSTRASDGGALESNGIIVGNKNEFKEVSNISPLAVPFIARVTFADASVQYTEWCKNCLDESDFHMVGGGKFVVKVLASAPACVCACACASTPSFLSLLPPQKSGWRKLGAAQGVSYEIRKNDIIYDDRGDVSRSDFTVRASLANGRFSDGWGACDRCVPHLLP